MRAAEPGENGSPAPEPRHQYQHGANCSTMPNTSAAARLQRLRHPGLRHAHCGPWASVIFQRPEIRNNKRKQNGGYPAPTRFFQPATPPKQAAARLCHTVGHGPYCSPFIDLQGAGGLESGGAPTSVELVDEVYQIPANEWRYVEIDLKQQPALVSATFQVLTGAGQARIALMRRQDLERLRGGEPHGVMT